MSRKKATTRFKIDNYGELLALAYDLALVHYQEQGSYQGEYVAILSDEDRLFIFHDFYGSCSGCDFLEDIRDWDSREVAYEDVKKYIDIVKPRYIVPLDKGSLMLREALRHIPAIMSEDL